MSPNSDEQSKDKGTLKDLDASSLSDIFKYLAEQNRTGIESLRPTLATVSGLVGKLQEIGLDQVGIELASHDSLRALNLYSKGKSNNTAHMILSIYETRYLVRIRPENMIDCYPDNLNKSQMLKSNINSDEFWYKENTMEARFFQYDLSQKDDCISFLTNILQTASICATEEELRQFDRPVEEKAKLSKQSRGLK